MITQLVGCGTVHQAKCGVSLSRKPRGGFGGSVSRGGRAVRKLRSSNSVPSCRLMVLNLEGSNGTESCLAVFGTPAHPSKLGRGRPLRFSRAALCLCCRHQSSRAARLGWRGFTAPFVRPVPLQNAPVFVQNGTESS